MPIVGDATSANFDAHLCVCICGLCSKYCPSLQPRHGNTELISKYEPKENEMSGRQRCREAFNQQEKGKQWFSGKRAIGCISPEMLFITERWSSNFNLVNRDYIDPLSFGSTCLCKECFLVRKIEIKVIVKHIVFRNIAFNCNTNRVYKVTLF